MTSPVRPAPIAASPALGQTVMPRPGAQASVHCAEGQTAGVRVDSYAGIRGLTSRPSWGEGGIPGRGSLLRKGKARQGLSTLPLPPSFLRW